jgi:hypothetical protein
VLCFFSSSLIIYFACYQLFFKQTSFNQNKKRKLMCLLKWRC